MEGERGIRRNAVVLVCQEKPTPLLSAAPSSIPPEKVMTHGRRASEGVAHDCIKGFA